MKKISGMKFVLAIEIIYIAVLVIKCFGICTEFIFDKYNLNKSIEGDLIYFDDGSVGMEAQSSEEVEILNGFLDLGSGAYRVKVTYDSISNYDNISIDNSAGRVAFSTDNSNLKASEIWLHDGENEMQSNIWLRGKNNKVRIAVWYHGNGKLAIKSIYIEEKREYRIITCIATVFLFVVCNSLWFLFCKKSNRSGDEKTRFVILGIIGITVFSSLPYFADFLYIVQGHDLYFHLSRIISLANGLREFQIPHRMQFEMLNGYGDASPLYYGEIFLLLPAILYNFYVPVQTCYQVFVVFTNLMTCIISYWCFSRISKDWRKGLLGASIYTLSAYRLTNVLVRAAVGEYIALTFFPLLVYGFYNIYSKEEKIYLKDYAAIILAATGIINSHILSCEMIVIFLVFFMVINYKKTFNKNILGALFKSSIFTLLLNLWFIVPFLQSMGMEIRVADKDNINMIEGNNVYLSQLFGIFHTANGESVWRSTQNEMPLALGFPILLGIAMFLFVLIKRESWGLFNHKYFKASYVCFILGVVALFFTSNLCK